MRGKVERHIFDDFGRIVDGDSPTICLHGARDKYKRLSRESIAFLVICSFDPVGIGLHVIEEDASLFRVLQYENASRNQYAFTIFDSLISSDGMPRTALCVWLFPA